jgi:dTDP-4-amino-4,6-dideoxygalactose transaminase
MINVTKTYLPNKEKYKKYVDKIFQKGIVTNYGPLVKELENRLAKYLNVRNVILVANGTLALEVAYKTLDLKGEIITTPFTFIATTSSILSNGMEVVYSDIDPETFNLCPNNIERSITRETSAIVPVHVFGNSCNVDKIEKIANENNLKIIYDASHAFGIETHEKSLLSYGDISTLSFHATKLFHTIEGGALVINDDSLSDKARKILNFGIDGQESIPYLGINAKMNEFEAAMGLCVLDDIEDIISMRKEVFDRYRKGLSGAVDFQKKDKFSTYNYSYFPVLFQNNRQMLKVKRALNNEDIFPRRYFYPSLDTLSFVKADQFMSISRNISERVMCLPFYPDIKISQQKKIIQIILKTIQHEK